MRFRLLSLFALVASAAGVAAFPVPQQQPPGVPWVTLPPDEMKAEFVVRAAPAGADWGVVALKAPESWAVTKGKGVKVFVLDTGLDSNHPDLKSRIASTDDLKDFTGSRSGWTDKQGHGTHCAGSVLASGSLPGVAPEATLGAGKVLGDNGSGAVTWIAAGIDWATGRGADVISMSLGGPSADSYIPPALARAEAAGVLVIVAAGNEGPREGTVGYPGAYPKAVAIGAVDRNLAVASFSSRGAAVYAAGPGVNIRSTYPGGQYATPNLAGVAALWVAAHPEIKKVDRPAAFRKALVAASKDLGPVGRDTAYGYGFPDASKMVAGGGTVPPVEPPVPPVVPPVTPPVKGFTGTITYTYENGVLKGVETKTTPAVAPAPKKGGNVSAADPPRETAVTASGRTIVKVGNHWQYEDSPVEYHTHTCTSCKYTWDHDEDGGTHLCPKCGGRPPKSAGGYEGNHKK